MKKSFINTLIFAAGAAVGSAVTWKLAKSYYEKLAQEEIDSVKEAFGYNTMDEDDENNSEEENSKEETDEYEKLVEDLNYENNSGDEEKEGVSPMVNEPIIIRPEEFDEIYEYEAVTLTYYADGVVTDEADAVMDTDEVESTIGLESLKHFGEYEEDSVFVRNHNLKTDYEICRDLRKYYEDEDSSSEED